MGLIQKQIADGVRLSYLETGKFKTNFMSFSFIAPLERESTAGRALIPQVLLRGSEKYPTMADISKKLDYLYATSLGARNYKRGDKQVFGISAGMIDSEYTIGGEELVSEVVDVIEDILLHPVTSGEAFDAAYVESEKSNLIDTINGNINDKTYYAYLRCIEEMCCDERYGLSENGTVEEVKALTPEGVYALYRRALETCPIEIFFVGKCDIDSLAERFRAMLSGISRTPVAIPDNELVSTVREVKRVTESMPVSQGKLAMGFRTGVTLSDEELPALMLFNGIFGGSATSKLFMNVREKMSLCYYCSSSLDSSKGLMLVQSGIEVKNREVAEEAILKQLEDVKRGDFDSAEFDGALLGIINDYRELSDSARGLERWYLGRLLDGVVSEPEDVIEALGRVTREQILEVANRVSLDTVYFLNGTLKGDNEDE